jgi:hypothetical protein
MVVFFHTNEENKKVEICETHDTHLSSGWIPCTAMEWFRLWSWEHSDWIHHILQGPQFPVPGKASSVPYAWMTSSSCQTMSQKYAEKRYRLERWEQRVSERWPVNTQDRSTANNWFLFELALESGQPHDSQKHKGLLLHLSPQECSSLLLRRVECLSWNTSLKILHPCLTSWRWIITSAQTKRREKLKGKTCRRRLYVIDPHPSGLD